MKLISLNCNGIRSSLGKGLSDYILDRKPDFICFQEIKAIQEQIPPSLWEEGGYTPVFHSAEKKDTAESPFFIKNLPGKLRSGSEIRSSIKKEEASIWNIRNLRFGIAIFLPEQRETYAKRQR